MDLNTIKDSLPQNLYEAKALYRKAQNAVMNYTEMEAKVREATNNEPWGASSSSLQEIANGTFNYATLNEIMPMIYKRFTEKTAEEWRQIYKALQLLEFLIKNGSERVIDDARSHLSLLKMLRQFHFIDQNGKDQGINVRNRAKELAELLSDVDRIRVERKKARTTRNKYGGYEGGGMGLGGSMSGAGRYGGYGADSGGYGGYSGGVYGDGGGFGGRGAEDEYSGTQSRRERFDEYDEYDDGGATTSSKKQASATSPTTRSKPTPPKPKEPEVDLFDFGDDDITSTPVMQPPMSNGKQPAAGPSNDFDVLAAPPTTRATAGADDDFDDFQTAASTAAPAAPMNNNPANLFSSISPPPSSTGPTQPPKPNYTAFHTATPNPNTMASQRPQGPPTPLNQPRPTAYQAQTPNYFGSIATATPPAANTANPLSPPLSTTSSATSAAGAPAQKKASSDPFANLTGAKKAGPASKGPTMADMAKQKASAGIWGASAPAQSQQGGAAGGDLI